MEYSIFHRLLAPVVLVALWSPGVAGAGSPPPATRAALAPAVIDDLDELPHPSVLATDGMAVEAILADVGLGPAWRATIGLGPIARGMTVDYEGEGQSITQLVTTALDLKATANSHAAVVRRLRRVALLLNDARDIERDRLMDRNEADVYFRGTHALMQSVALDLFSGGDPEAEALLGLDGEALTHAQRTQELTSHTLEEMMDRRRQAEADLLAAIAAHEAAIGVRERMAELHAELQEEATRLARARGGYERAARAVVPQAAEDFALAAVPREPGLTPRALDAYVTAESMMAELVPRCRISWQMVAAVGSVEGRHGRYDDRSLGMDGISDRPIIGLPLDGVATDNFGDVVASIPDTDQGRLDGDPVFDRAVGPMQFIPQTWVRWELDGDGDEEMDPQDLDDAAVTAAAYLCNYGSMRTWDVWNTAVFGYNHSAAYVTSVKSSLDRVALVVLPDIDEVDELEIPRPGGEWIPLPEPENEDPPDGTVNEAAG